MLTKCFKCGNDVYDSEMEEFWENQEASKNENGLDDVAKEQQG